MAQVIDVEIIANSLFKSLFNIINSNEQNVIMNILNINKKINNTEKILMNHFENQFNNWFEILTDGQQDLNEDIINLVNNKFDNLYSYINNKIINEITKIENKFLSCFKNINNKNKEDNKKYKVREYNNNKTKICGCERSRNKGYCKKIISINKNFCKYHKDKYEKHQQDEYQDGNNVVVDNNTEEEKEDKIIQQEKKQERIKIQYENNIVNDKFEEKSIQEQDKKPDELICDDCGFEIDESGCVCPDICKNLECDNYDEDEIYDLCKKCKEQMKEQDESDEMY